MGDDQEITALPYDEWVESLQDNAQEYERVMRLWHDTVSEAFAKIYIAFEDAGLVPPYYDPTHLCATEEETWEVFV